MALRIWMKQTIGERAADLKETHRWMRMLIVDPISDLLYLALHHDDLFREFPEVPVIPQEFVGLVTYRDKIYADFRKQGVYKLDGARLEVRTSYEREFTPPKRVQHVSVRGPDIRSVRKIVQLVRQGRIEPMEDYTIGAENDVDLVEASAADEDHAA